MKERLLLFVPIIGFSTQTQLQTAINQFRKRYPHLRLVSEVETIDYAKQFVKIILVHIHQITGSKIVSFTFTNTSGRQYETIALKLE